MDEEGEKISHRDILEIFQEIDSLLRQSLNELSHIDLTLFSKLFQQCKEDLLKKTIEKVNSLKETHRFNNLPKITDEESVLCYYNLLMQEVLIELNSTVSDFTLQCREQLMDPMGKGSLVIQYIDKQYDMILSLDLNGLGSLYLGVDEVIRKAIESLTLFLYPIQDFLAMLKQSLEQPVPSKEAAAMLPLGLKRIAEEKTLYNEKMMEAIDHYFIQNRQIVRRLEQSMTDELRKSNMLSINEIEKASKDFQLLSRQVIEQFKELLTELQGMQPKVQASEDEAAIFISILETMRLKGETIKERDNEFTLLKKEKLVAYNKRLQDFCNDFARRITLLFEQMVETADKQVFVDFQRSYDKLFNELSDKNLKEDLAYLRSDLLFEVVTYEEIIKGSLPKLISGGNSFSVRIAEVIKGTYEVIQTMIQKAGIYIISPTAGEKYNGIFHEILHIEIKEGFTRGDIIEVYTLGYKYLDRIIIRANVIAAG